MTTTPTITAADTLGLLARVVDAAPRKGDTTANCYYSIEFRDSVRGAVGDDPTLAPADKRQDDTPCCIVGQVVHLVGGGAALARLREYEGADSANNEAVQISLGFTRGALNVLRDAQTAQDSGETWADAFESARKVAAAVAE